MRPKAPSPRSGQRPGVENRVAPYVSEDPNGVLRVGGTRVSLDSIVLAFQQGQSPESIRQHYPILRLEDVYGALTYYLAHQREVDDYLRRQDAAWERGRREADARRSPFVERLQRAMRTETANVV